MRAAHRLDKVIALKPAVDKARFLKEWGGSNPPATSYYEGDPLANPYCFITTNQFLPFLDENNFDYPGRDERAVLVTLAVLADSWPPPPEVVAEIMELLRTRIPDPVERPGRAPEIVVAYLLGWPRPDLNRAAARWKGGLPEARECLRAVMAVSTDSCLTWLNKFVIGFPAEDAGYWAGRTFNLFTAGNPRLRCHCFLRVAPPGTTAEEIKRLTGNAYKKGMTCYFGQHHLSLWNPAKLSLWLFAQRAVKGFTGEFKPGGFPTGILYDLLWRFKEEPRKLLLENVAHRYCDACEKWTVHQFCPSPWCHQRQLDPQYAPINTFPLLILEEEVSLEGEIRTFTPKLAWTCRAPASDLTRKAWEAKRKRTRNSKAHASALAAKANEAEKEQCLNVYVQVRERCKKRDCSEPHDRCPLLPCGAQHPTGKKRKLSTVYFYEGGRGGEVIINAHLARTLAEPDEAEPLTGVLDEAFAAAWEKFKGQGRWIEAVISRLEEDFERWLGLVQSAGEVDWDELWDALGDAPDRPATPEELEKDFALKVKPSLSAVFKLKFGRAGSDWQRLEEYRPQRPRAERREEA